MSRNIWTHLCYQ